MGGKKYQQGYKRERLRKKEIYGIYIFFAFPLIKAILFCRIQK